MTPHIITVSGPSLSGKTEFTKILTLQREHDFNAVVSVTTRPQRSSEIHGVDYNFVTPQEYAKLTFIQKTDFNNYQYGVSEEEVLSKKDKPILWVVAPKSIPQIEEYCRKAGFNLTKIFITNPQEVLFERLLQRFKDDKNSSSQTYVNRLSSIVNVESEWVKEATNPDSILKYDLVYTAFNNENSKHVINEALAFIESQSSSNVKKLRM